MTEPRDAAPRRPGTDRLAFLARISPRSAALIALTMAVPIGLLFGAAVLGMQPLGDALRAVLTDDGIRPNPVGRVYMVVSLLLLPVALGLAAWPMLRRSGDRRRRAYALNVSVVMVVAGLMWLTWGQFAIEVVRCDVLGIPNCD